MKVQGRALVTGGASGLGLAAALVTAVVENPVPNGEVIRLDGALRMPPR
jgi:hypothetical protein